MAIVDTIRKLFEYRENISNIIRLKDIDIPENTKLQNIPQYINELEKKEHIEAPDVWSEEFQEQCVAESLANYIHERSLWNGHVDSTGLKEIGWTDDDIEYFQVNGVDWMEEDDDKYIVSEYEKELYRTNAIRTVSTKIDGVTYPATYNTTLINNNDPQIVEWRNTIKWMPKFQTTVMPASLNFRNFRELIGCPYFDFSSTTNPSYLFARCDKLKCVPPISFATSSWNGSYLFYECINIKTIPDTINWEKCNNVTYTFGDCGSLLYLPSLNLSNVTSINNAFTNCKKLNGITNIITSNKLTNTADSFAGCRSLLTVPLFDTSNVTNMQNMFGNCQTLVNVPCYDTSNNTTFRNFFKNDSNLLSCPEFNFTNKITSYEMMFIGCEKLIKIPSNFNFESCTIISQMFYRCLALTEIPIKFNLNNEATTPAEGIKSYSQCIYQCTNLKRVDIGLFHHYASNSTTGSFIDLSAFIEEINVDNFDKMKGNVLSSNDLFNITKIGGELKGINQSVDMSKMRRLPKTEMIKIINAIEDVNGLGYTPTLTFGGEALRNLTIEEKAIATNKGWKLI